MATLPSNSALDWPALAQQAAPFTSLASVTDPVSGLVDLTWCGLKTSLSAILKNQPASGLHSLAIFADTLVLDVPQVNTSGLLLVVRELDASALGDQPLRIQPGADGSIVAQVLVGDVGAGSFCLAASGQDTTVSPPTSTGPLLATTYLANRNEPLSALAPDQGSRLSTLLGYSWNVNSLYSSFSAAAWLMDERDNPLASATAKAMLAWVVASSAGLVNQQQLPSDYGQLYSQAAALLVTLNVADGATFVPVLSSAWYSQQMDAALGIIRNYEGQLATLDTQGDIAQAIATVSATLQGTANDEIAPLQTQLDNINLNTAALLDDIRQLRSDFTLQTQRANTALGVLKNQIALQTIKDQLAAELGLAMNVLSLAFDAAKLEAGDATAVKDAVEHGVKAIKSLVEVIESGQGANPDNLSQAAVELLQNQAAMMNTVLDGSLLWAQAIAQQSGGVLPTDLAAITLDPVTDWDNYLAAAEANITSLQRDIGGGALPASDTYLASLKILASYGKAIGGKFVAYVAQLVQATVVIAQIKAARDVEARWQATEAGASSDVQRLAALKALVLGRQQAIKRALYQAWSYYAASYFYLNFQSPPRNLHLDMDAAALQAALAGVADWVAAALGNAPGGDTVQLPSTNAHIELDYAILAEGASAGASDTALLDQAADGSWNLAFSLPLGSAQLDGVLPNRGQCAIWIREAAFFLDGITPNSKGNVIASVTTSGTYQNGLSTQDAYTFVTKRLSGNYAYAVADQRVYSPWAIDAAVYMTPTPYTQWTLNLAPGSGDPSTASRLRVKLVIAYRA
ncbi:hypothetical protein [Pseudomonas sp. NPDC089406]|uniref:hypothetical protein n=1 Tax=Pseudomonas sp. NPDC089406 TaxID=3364463 RepID=UPI00384FE815